MNLTDAIVEQASRRPDARALVSDAEGLSYRALLKNAREMQGVVTALDLEPGAAVAVRAEKSPRAIALILGCLLSRTPVLVPAADTAPEVLAELYEHAHCRYELTAESPPRRIESSRRPGHVPISTALMLTTSGSTTGVPKVVAIPADAVDRFIEWAATAFDIGTGSVVLNYAPLNFDLCLLDIWAALAHGGEVVLVRRETSMHGTALAALLTRHEITIVQAVPMLFSLLADSSGTAAFPAVRQVIFTGDRMPPAALARLGALFPHARKYNVYGCTETNDTFVHELTGDGDPELPVPIGAPLPGVRALVVAPDNSVLDGPAYGELWVSSPFQSSGYLGTAAEADRFAQHPDFPGRTFFRSGDRVQRTADGLLVLLGRLDFQVKVRGIRIDLEEVERALLRHPEVVEAAALAAPDPLAGNQLHVVVRRRTDSTLDSLRLRRHCAQALPNRALPTSLRITEHPLPRTPTGKVDRSATGRADA